MNNKKFSQTMDNVKTLAPLIKENAQKAEANQSYPSEVIGEVRRLKISNAFLPQNNTSELLSIKEMLELWEEQASQDGSYGWLSIANALASANCAAYLPEKGYDAVFGGNNDVYIAGQYFANGKGSAVDEGYIIEGGWQFGSGISHADWVVAGFVPINDGRVEKMEDGTPNIMIAVVPSKSVIIEENWDVMGLSATGSFDYRIESHFVPSYMIFPLYTKKKERGDSKFDLGIMPMAALSHGSWALGMAKRMLSEIHELCSKKVRTGDSNSISAKMTFQNDYANSVAKLQGAKLFLINKFEKLVSEYESEAPKNVLDMCHAELRLAACHATNVSVDVCNFVHSSAGTIASRKNNVMERYFRDIHFGKQHFVVNEKAQVDAARILLGA